MFILSCVKTHERIIVTFVTTTCLCYSLSHGEDKTKQKGGIFTQYRLLWPSYTKLYDRTEVIKQQDVFAQFSAGFLFELIGPL
jgi:hypothetical protein